MRLSAYDEHAKNLLSLLLEAHGRVRPQQRVKSHVQYADVSFQPRKRRTARARALEPHLGLLTRYLGTPVLFEHFSSAPTEQDLRGCLRKLFNLMAHREAEARRKQPSIAQPFTEPPTSPPTSLKLVLLLAVPTPALAGFGPQPVREPDAPSGLYALLPAYHTEIIVVPELPETLDTLWLRMMGRGEVYARALQAFTQLPADHPLRLDVMNLLVEHYEWMIDQEEEANDDDDEEELLMYTSPLLDRYNNRLKKRHYEEFQQEELVPQIERSRSELLLGNLQVRFGSIDEGLSRVAQRLAKLEVLEAIRLSLHLTREELLARFGAEEA